MSDYRELIERLAEATGADRELDDLIMSLGHFRDKRHAGAYYDDNTPAVDDVWVDRDTNEWRSTAAFDYTASIDAAIGLVEKMLPGWDCGLETGDCIAYGRVWQNGCHDDTVVHADAATPALALCLAFLRALQSQQKERGEAA